VLLKLLATWSETLPPLVFSEFKCPCVILPGSNRCITYDARFQAATIEEAIITFVDTSMDPRIYDEWLGGPIVSFYNYFSGKSQ
jgi:hypothetical protein